MTSFTTATGVPAEPNTWSRERARFAGWRGCGGARWAAGGRKSRLLAVENVNREGATPAEPAGEESYRFVEEGFKRGVQFGHAKYAGMGNVVKIKPPLVITETEAERVMEVFEQVTQLLSS